jgi:formylglycine-generating enzyme required for sulfatase activity
MRHLVALLLSGHLVLTMAAEGPPAYPQWDGRETVAEYAARAHLPTSQRFRLTNDVEIEMLLVPAGRFKMGAPESSHGVTITRPFYLSKYKVTKAQHLVMSGRKPEVVDEIRKSLSEELALHPTLVAHDEAQRFCERLRKRFGKPFRLPTEAEWEFSCRGGAPGVPCAQHKDPYASHICDLVRLETTPVGKQVPNAFGLHDMLDIVEEWCSDWYAPYPDGNAIDPLGPEASEARVVRGSKHPCMNGPQCSPCCRGFAAEDLLHCSPCRAGMRLALDVRSMEEVCRQELASDGTAADRRWHRLLELDDQLDGCRWIWTEEWCNVHNGGFSVRQHFQLSPSGRDSLFLEFSLRKDEESAARYVRECRMLQSKEMRPGFWGVGLRLGDESWHRALVTQGRTGYVLLAVRHKRLVLHVRATQSNVEQAPTGVVLDVLQKLLARYDAMESHQEHEERDGR